MNRSKLIAGLKIGYAGAVPVAAVLAFMATTNARDARTNLASYVPRLPNLNLLLGGLALLAAIVGLWSWWTARKLRKAEQAAIEEDLRRIQGHAAPIGEVATNQPSDQLQLTRRVARFLGAGVILIALVFAILFFFWFSDHKNVGRAGPSQPLESSDSAKSNSTSAVAPIQQPTTPPAPQAETEGFTDDVLLNDSAGDTNRYRRPKLYVSESPLSIRFKFVQQRGSGSPTFYIDVDGDDSTSYDRTDFSYRIVDVDPLWFLYQTYWYRNERTRYGYINPVYLNQRSAGRVMYNAPSNNIEEYVYIVPKRELSLSGTSVKVDLYDGERLGGRIHMYRYRWPIPAMTREDYMANYRSHPQR